MNNSIKILKIYPKSFIANVYTTKPFRMIGLIDVDIKYEKKIERVTLAYFRSSGTNSGKIRGLWYPIVGIKLYTGPFTEFTEYINYILTGSSPRGIGHNGWLAKSLFFSRKYDDENKVRGFSNGRHYNSLLIIGKTLRELYDNGKFQEVNWLNPESLNYKLTSKEVYENNMYTQKENYERFIRDIFEEGE